MNYTFKIIFSKPAYEAQTYLIYNSHREKPIPDVWIKFEDDSSMKNYKFKKAIIGEFILSEITDIKLSGTFSCKLEKGTITDGKFSVIKFTPDKIK